MLPPDKNSRTTRNARVWDFFGNADPCVSPQMSWRPQYRSSKFRNVYGKAASREHCFDGIPITKNVHDNHFCAVNARYLAIVTESAGGGSFLVIPLEQVRFPMGIYKVSKFLRFLPRHPAGAGEIPTGNL